MDKYEQCWMSGQYEDQDCSNCPHKNDCSGSEIDDE